jgi:hypothetical protein
MANFKYKILNTLKNDNSIDNTFKYFSNIQNNLIKNYSNPVFSNNDKNRLLQKYSKVEFLGKSIYKYNLLKQNNMNFENEKENISNIVLKGGISIVNTFGIMKIPKTLVKNVRHWTVLNIVLKTKCLQDHIQIATVG